MAQLKFSKEKTAVGMYAKDGEYVVFSGNCECTGQVKLMINHYYNQLIIVCNLM